MERTVYHGSSIEIKHPGVDPGRPNLDFVPGFYVNAIFSQTKEWARKIVEDREWAPIINTLHLKQRNLHSTCRHIIFKSYDKDWLELVTKSRPGNSPWTGYDYIEGGVTDDRVLNTISLFMGRYISAEEALNIRNQEV